MDEFRSGYSQVLTTLMTFVEHGKELVVVIVQFNTACTREKEYTTLKPVPSKRLGMGPGGGEGRSVGLYLL